MDSIFFTFLYEVGLPMFTLASMAAIGTFAAKNLAKAWKEDDRVQIWFYLWLVSLCISSAVKRGVL